LLVFDGVLKKVGAFQKLPEGTADEKRDESESEPEANVE